MQKVAILILTVLLSSTTVVRADDDAAVHRGSLLFGANCFQCHGMDAQGGIAPRLAGAPKTAATWPFERFRAAVLSGYGENQRRLNEIMPHFGYVKIAPSGREPTDDELRAIQAYLKSIKSKS